MSNAKTGHLTATAHACRVLHNTLAGYGIFAYHGVYSRAKDTAGTAAAAAQCQCSPSSNRPSFDAAMSDLYSPMKMGMVAMEGRQPAHSTNSMDFMQL
jgi:hypothetical protein